MSKTNMDFESFVEGILDTIDQYSAMQKKFPSDDVSEKACKPSDLTKHLKDEGLDAETLRKKKAKTASETQSEIVKSVVWIASGIAELVDCGRGDETVHYEVPSYIAKQVVEELRNAGFVANMKHLSDEKMMGITCGLE